MQAVDKAVDETVDEGQRELDEMLKEIWERHCTTGETWEEYKARHIDISEEEKMRRKVEAENRKPGHLNDIDGYDCLLCLNRGYINQATEYLGHWQCVAEWCSCKPIRRNILRLKNSGLQRGLGRMDDFKVTEDFQRQMLDTAKAYLAADHSRGESLYFGGTPGCGKTMLGTAVCRELIFRGNDVVYMPWVTEAQKIKSLAMDEEQAAYIDTFKKVGYLYIDDLFKPVPGQAGPTAADVRLAYEIINFRYINHKPMIISSEKLLGELAEVDEATISRIYEMSRGFVVNVARKPGRNWRLKGMGEVI